MWQDRLPVLLSINMCGLLVHFHHLLTSNCTTNKGIIAWDELQIWGIHTGQQVAIVFSPSTDRYSSRNWHRDRDECGLIEEDMLVERSEGCMDERESVCVRHCTSHCVMSSHSKPEPEK